MTRIAIIGGGPRGLWATEEVVRLSREHGLPVPHIDVFDDPASAGPYGPAQPDHWRINVRSGVIRTGISAFDDWREPDDGFGEYPPRALVGRFLEDSWSVLPVNRIPRRVENLGELDAYDEILLATGHATDWPGALDGAVPVYPAGALDVVRPGERVAVRGAALTFIDACLDLTLGRGGRFEEGRYVPSGREPAAILPYTRSGRLMEVKPDPPTRAELFHAIDPARPAVLAAGSLPELVQVIGDAAARLLDAPRAEIDAVLAGTDPVDRELERLREGVAGTRSARSAVGLAFRELYPEIVTRYSYGGRTTLEGFGDFAARMERLAFGPPRLNAERLLMLVDAGLVVLDHLGSDSAPAADVLVDSVQAPACVLPGTLEHRLVEEGIARLAPGTRALDVAPDGTLVGQSHIAAVGRMTEEVVLGNDTLSRAMHTTIPRWAERVVGAKGLDPDLHGTPPMTARLEPWMSALTPETASALLAEHGSPVNLLETGAFTRNAADLVAAGERHGVDVRVFYARKANKALVFVDAAIAAGHGVDVASYRELEQTLAAGMPGECIILSAAVKPDALLRLAVDNGVTVSVDSVAELHRLSALADGRRVAVAPRLAPDPAAMPPTRFGERASTWREALSSPVPGVDVTGVHVHLHGYAAADRVAALREAMDLIDALAPVHPGIGFIDVGGGVPMSYLDDEAQWRNYRSLRADMVAGRTAPFTWKADPLTTTYPYFQRLVRGQWLDGILAAVGPALRERGLRLHLEPGRRQRDGRGQQQAEAAVVKNPRAGVPRVGGGAHPPQVRTTSDDYLVDPLLLRTQPESAEVEGFLVGAYCIEDEVILRRRMRFPRGVAPGDVIAVPNTAGYFMHILESASHQIPLARNVVLGPDGPVLDRIDH